jgi:hypothetical protein
MDRGIADRIQLSYEVTRADWIEFNMAWADVGPDWKLAAAQRRKQNLKSMPYVSLMVIAGMAVIVGYGRSTSGMFLEGALFGVLFSAVIWFGISRIDVLGAMKKEHMRALQNADLGAITGPMNIELDSQGITFVSTGRNARVLWNVMSANVVNYSMLLNGPGGPVLVPRRVFETIERATEFESRVGKWITGGQRPYRDQLASYLKGRDIGCVGCGYNLRDYTGEKCAECGLTINLEDLVAGKGRKIVGKV